MFIFQLTGREENEELFGVFFRKKTDAIKCGAENVESFFVGCVWEYSTRPIPITISIILRDIASINSFGEFQWTRMKISMWIYLILRMIGRSRFRNSFALCQYWYLVKFWVLLQQVSLRFRAILYNTWIRFGIVQKHHWWFVICYFLDFSGFRQFSVDYLRDIHQIGLYIGH